MIKISNLNKDFGGFGLKNINFELPTGFIMGIVGPNGSGKTTLIKSIMGLEEIDSGEVLIFGKSLKENEEEIKNKIGFVYDNLNFYPNISVKDFKSIMKLFYKSFEEDKFNFYLKEFNINEKSKIKYLSKGQGAKLMLANALSHKAKLLILDEPTAGLDPVVRREVIGYLQEFVSDDTSVIICTHITEELDKIADYITFIEDGSVRFSIDKETLWEKFLIVRGYKDEVKRFEKYKVAYKEFRYFSEMLIKIENNVECMELIKGAKTENLRRPNIEDMMYYYMKGE